MLNERSLRPVFRPLFVVLLLGSAVSGCNAEYDDVYYAKQETVFLLPKEAKNPRTAPLEPPYYRFQIARGYLSSNILQDSSLEMNPLYPSMSHFTRSAQKIWYPEKRGVPINPDRLRVFVSFFLDGENDEGLEATRYIDRLMKDKTFELVVPSGQFKDVPHLRIYRNIKRSAWEYYVFKQADGRTVVVKCDLGCTGHTTWKDALRLHYIFPQARLPEMAEIDLAVNRLIDSCQPTRFEK